MTKAFDLSDIDGPQGRAGTEDIFEAAAEPTLVRPKDPESASLGVPSSALNYA
jgi:hypothetical protein